MPWVKLEDQLSDHLKFVGIDLKAMGLWSLTLIDSCRRLTDGFVPASEPRRYDATKRHTDELVRRGLWEPVDGGWLIHDFHDYQPTAESVRRQRDELSQVRAEAGRKGAAKRWQPDGNRHGKADGNPDGKPPHLPSGERWQKNGNGYGNAMAPIPKGSLVSSLSSSNPADARADDDDDDNDDPPMDPPTEALAILARRALDRRQNELPSQPIHRPARWLAQARSDLHELHADQARTLAAEGRSALSIADAIDRTPAAAERPRCATCNGFHQGACPIAELEAAP